VVRLSAQIAIHYPPYVKPSRHLDQVGPRTSERD